MCYRFDRGTGGRFHNMKKAAVIKAIETDADLLDQWHARKAALNKALTSVLTSGVATSISMGRGTHVSLDESLGTNIIGAEYEFWPEATYVKYFGSPDTNGRGHVRLRFKNQAGVAIFARPPGVVKVVPSEQSTSHRHRTGPNKQHE